MIDSFFFFLTVLSSYQNSMTGNVIAIFSLIWHARRILDLHLLISLVQDVIYVKEDCLELEVGDNTIIFEIMFPHYFIQFLLIYFMTNFGHCSYEIFTSNATRIIGVELVEDCAHLVIVKEVLHI